MKYLILPVLFALGFGSSAFASDYGHSNNSNLGTDSFRTSNGAECSTSRETGQDLSFGTFGREEDDGRYNQGVYMQYTIKLGQERSKIDCNRLFNLEVERQTIEIQKLKAELDLLKSQTTKSNSDW